MAACPTQADWSFGPAVNARCRRFDFTLCFEDVCFSILPSALLLLCIPWRVRQLSHVPAQTHAGHVLLWKLAGFTSLVALRVVLLVLSATKVARQSPVSIAAGTITIVATGGAAVISYYEHVRSIAPSALLELYLLATTLLNLATVRTSWLLSQPVSTPVISSFVLALNITLLCLECTRKTPLISGVWSNEETSGLWEHGLFSWLLPMLWQGCHATLALDALPTISSKLGSELLHAQLRRHTRLGERHAKHALLAATFKAYKFQFSAAVIPRICWTASKFAQPFLISTTVAWVGTPSANRPQDQGYGLIGAYGFVYAAIALAQAFYWQNTYRFIVTVRGGLSSMIFDKTTRLNPSHKLRHDPMVLMGTDIEKIALSLRQVHELWASVIEIALALWLLEKQLGVACVAPAAVALGCLVAATVLSSKTSARQRAWMVKVQDRLNATSRVLSDMKAVKLLGLSSNVSYMLRRLRKSELDTSQGYRLLLTWSIFLGGMPQLMSPALTLALFVIIAAATQDKTLFTGQAFTSLSLISLLTSPLNQLVQAAPQFLACTACFDRIQEYLTQREKAVAHSWTTGITSGSSELIEDSKSSVVEFCHAAFAWSESSDPVLRGIDMTIPPGSIEVICGPIGSGKSTLLQSILGIPMQVAGSMHLAKTSVSYCSQVPWLMTSSVRENITAGLEFDERWYEYTIWACELERDLQRLPRGDSCQIGSQGVRLSGGQKQRIALARLVYSRSKIALCDDVFSGLDATTEQAVAQRLFASDGYFRTHGITVVLVTHSRSVLAFANHVTILNNEGRILRNESFDTLDPASSFVNTIPSPTPEKGESIAEPTTVEHPSMKAKIEVSKEVAVDATRSGGDTAVYWYYAKAAGALVTLLFLSGTMACTFCESFAVLWVQWWTTADTRHHDRHVRMYLGVYVFFNAFGSLLLLISCWLNIVRMTTNSALNLHDAVLSTVMRAPLSFFITTDTGTTTNRFSQDMELVDMTLPLSALNAAFAATSCIMQTIIVIVVARYLAATVPLVMVVVYFLQKFYLRTSRQVRLIEIEQKAPLYTRFIETVSGLATIQAFGWQQRFQTDTYCLLDLSQRPFYLLFCIQLWVNLVLNLVVAGLAIVLMALIVTLTSKTDVGFVGVALVTIMSFNMMLTNLVKYWTMLETSVGAVSRVKKFVANTEMEFQVVPDTTLGAAWPARGQVDISHLTVSHSPEDPPALQDVTLSISAGQHVAICGRSGSGKSSLILALLRILDAKAGSISIDSADLSTCNREVVRQKLNVVPQDALFLPGSYRENLDPHKFSTDMQIVQALSHTGLWEAVEAKGGLGGALDLASWSGGEKQLLSLTRAMLRNGNLLILDEVTSSVDTTTEAQMQEIIDTTFKSHTVISVMHRLAHVGKYDKVALLGDGKVLEFDSPSVLLSQRESHFAQLYASR